MRALKLPTRVITGEGLFWKRYIIYIRLSQRKLSLVNDCIDYILIFFLHLLGQHLLEGAAAAGASSAYVLNLPVEIAHMVLVLLAETITVSEVK